MRHANEYLALTVGDVTATAHGFTLRAHVSKQAHGVTRLRPLYVLAFRAEFAAFWDAHPYRAEPGHALFYRESSTWVGPPGSGQRQRYTHLTDRDVLRERLRLAGQRFEQEVQPQLRARICPHCNQENSPVATHCRICGQTLSIADVLRELEALKTNQAALVERALAEVMAKHRLERISPLSGWER